MHVRTSAVPQVEANSCITSKKSGDCRAVSDALMRGVRTFAVAEGFLDALFAAHLGRVTAVVWEGDWVLRRARDAEDLLRDLGALCADHGVAVEVKHLGVRALKVGGA